MPVYSYINDPDQSVLDTDLNKLIPGKLNSIANSFSGVLFIDVNISDKTILDEILKARGFVPQPNIESNISGIRKDWGTFTVATAPTDNVAQGDTGFCLDGNVGSPASAEYNGSNWVNVHNKIIIASL